jgi:PAS domain S-box-containing protein
MVNLLNVLVVEDSENDTLLLLEELRQKHYSPVHERVQNAPELITALGRRSWDVILSDYTMPQFSGPAALKLVREQGLHVPFIFVSGTHGEETAVDMMKAGANDYIVKGNLSRLVPAIERELASEQNRRARIQAESALQFLAAIVESTDDAIYGKTLDGTIVSWNRAAGRIYGYRAEEIIGRSEAVLIPTDRRGELSVAMSQIKRGQTMTPFETVRLGKDGRYIPASITISAINDTANRIVGSSVVARDITRRKRDEEERVELIDELTKALKQVKTLAGLLPICARCKSIRDDQGYWQKVETYLTQHSDAMFTHSVCPDCLKKHEPLAEVED